MWGFRSDTKRIPRLNNRINHICSLDLEQLPAVTSVRPVFDLLITKSMEDSESVGKASPHCACYLIFCRQLTMAQHQCWEEMVGNLRCNYNTSLKNIDCSILVFLAVRDPFSPLYFFLAFPKP